MYYHGGMSGGMWIGIFFYLIFWILIIAGAVMLIRSLSQKGRGEKMEESALDILKKRYARGEISKAEFEEKKRDIV